ncbi:MAG: hypothetical protein ACRDTT_16380 [Pseudonocardiaceae bacterium]
MTREREIAAAALETARTARTEARLRERLAMAHMTSAVLAAVRAGLTPTQIQHLSGLARRTVYNIILPEKTKEKP